MGLDPLPIANSHIWMLCAHIKATYPNWLIYLYCQCVYVEQTDHSQWFIYQWKQKKTLTPSDFWQLPIPSSTFMSDWFLKLDNVQLCIATVQPYKPLLHTCIFPTQFSTYGFFVLICQITKWLFVQFGNNSGFSYPNQSISNIRNALRHDCFISNTWVSKHLEIDYLF